MQSTLSDLILKPDLGGIKLRIIDAFSNNNSEKYFIHASSNLHYFIISHDNCNIWNSSFTAFDR